MTFPEALIIAHPSQLFAQMPSEREWVQQQNETWRRDWLRRVLADQIDLERVTEAGGPFQSNQHEP